MRARAKLFRASPGLTLRAVPLLWLMVVPATAVHALDPGRHITQYEHRRWIRGEGAPTLFSDLAQDRYGFLWLAGGDGLYRFDGSRFERVVRTASDSRASELLVTRDGSIWTWFRNEDAFAIYKDGRLRMKRAPRLQTGLTEVTAMMEGPDGTIWIGRGQYGYPLLSYKDGRWRVWGEGSGLPREQQRQILIGQDGTVWASYNGSVVRLKAGERVFKPVLAASDLRGTLAEDGQGRIWFVDDEGAFILASKRGEILRRPAGTKTRLKVGQRPLQTLFDRDGNLWIAAVPSGLKRVRVSSAGTALSIEAYNAKDGLSSDSLGPILEDRSGNLWVTSSRGLDRFRQVDVVAEPLLSNPAAFGDILYVGPDGTVFVGQARTVYAITSGAAPSVVMEDVTEPEAICHDSDGALVVAEATSVRRLAGTTVTRLPKPKTETGIYECLVGPDGKLWMSASGSGMYARNGSNWHLILPSRPGGDFSPTNMLRERSGSIALMSNERTLTRINPPRAPLTLLTSSERTGTLLSMYAAQNGILVGTVKGLVLLRGSVIRTLLSDRVPELTRINGIVQTASGETWLQGSKGIVRLATADLERAFHDPRYRPPRTLLGFEDGIPDVYPNQSGRSLVQGGDGRLWLATLAGTAWIDPQRAHRDLSPPIPVVTALHSRGDNQLDPADVVLRKGVGDVEIDYTAPDLSTSQRQRFRYRLVGYDGNWVDAGARRQAFYTNLRPGSYRFEVAAVSGEGIWSRSPAVVTFQVQPTFVQSRWFLALCILAALLAMAGLYRFRLAQATRRLNRTLEVRNAERERIARELHDTLLQTVQGLILRFRAVTDRLPQGAAERGRLQEVLAQANSTMSEARDRVQGLREPLGSERLEESLAERVKAASFPAETMVGVRVHGTRRAVIPEVATELAAIADEALKNVAQHARATAVDVSLSYLREALTLIVKDDGVGFDSASGPPAGHFGLIGMAERADRIKGSLTVTARVGEGTTVSVVVPGRRAYPIRTISDRLRGLLPLPA